MSHKHAKRIRKFFENLLWRKRGYVRTSYGMHLLDQSCGRRAYQLAKEVTE